MTVFILEIYYKDIKFSKKIFTFLQIIDILSIDNVIIH